MNTMAQGITAILTNIFTSASKLVFLMLAFTLCISFLMKMITQENFIYLCGSVFSYYFGVAQGSLSSNQQQLPPQPPRDPEALATNTAPAPTPITGVK